MKKYMILTVVLLGCAVYANAQSKRAVKQVKKPVTNTVVDTMCYMSVEDGGKTKNSVRLAISGSKVDGELRYFTEGEKTAEGVIEGTIKDNIITADWIFKKDGEYLKIPVSLKVTPTAVWQKPSAVNEKGEGYIPDDAEFLYEFPKIDCRDYPSKPLVHPKDKIKISIY